MSRLMFVYLTGSEKGKTRIFTQDHVTIGTSDDCDLTLVPEESGTLPEGVLSDIYDSQGTFHLSPRVEMDGLTITINGEALTEDHSETGYPLRDGDTLEFGREGSNAGVLFQVMPENFSAASLVRRNNLSVEEAPRQPVHPLTATLFVKELTASLWAEIPRRARHIGLTVAGVFTLAILGVIFFAFLVLHRNIDEIGSLRKQTEQAQAQRDQDQEMIRKQQEEIERLRLIGEQNRLFTQKIAERYSPGVCLIVGSYTFVERGTGRVLRYETADDANDAPIDQSGHLLASVDGAGPPVQIDYTGTGFLIEEGLIATNKHVVQPWTGDQIAQIILQQGAGLRPRRDTLVAFFPSIKTPFELNVAETSKQYDVALCSFEQGEAALPILPLSTEDPRSLIGGPVVLLGFPTGVDGLLQRIDEAERRDILKQHGESAEDVALGLAERGLVRPLTTTGIIGDALPSRITHSAQTTEGGSGSPMFDNQERVIAINSAILVLADSSQSFGGSNFGVPIKVVYDMLVSYRNGKSKAP